MTENLDPLTQLAIRHGTDKWGPHFYTPVYHQLFAHLRERPMRMLEIGVGGYGWKTVGGSSLGMWAEYFPSSHIVSFDIEHKQLDLGPRVTILQGSQDDPAFLARVSDEHGPFDIIIDDGSHVPRHVVISFEVLFPRMPDQGIYVVEDVQTCFWPMFGGSPDDGGATMKLAGSLLRQLNHAEIRAFSPWADLPASARYIKSLRALHNLIVIEKGDNTEPSNFDYELANPHAVRAIQTIERQLQDDPTPAGFANLISILNLGGDTSRAKTLLLEALARWPESTVLLMTGLEVLVDKQQRLDILQRLSRLEPEASRSLVEQTRSAILESEQ